MKTTTSTISNPINDSLLRYALILISFVLMCGALLPGAQAVSPAPDGGYPGGNTAENTAVGFLSLRSDTEGQFNTAVGAGALLANVGDQSSGTGVENTATGAGALLSNTTGFCGRTGRPFKSHHWHIPEHGHWSICPLFQHRWRPQQCRRC